MSAPLTMTPEVARERLAIIAEQDAEAKTLTERLDAAACGVALSALAAAEAKVATLQARVAELEAALKDARDHLRAIAQNGDTLSPQEFINHAAAGCGVDRHEYAGKMHPHRSIVELTGQVARLQPWARFGAKAFDAFWGDGDPGDIDGSDAQEYAVEAGLLSRRATADAGTSCSEYCEWTPDRPLNECMCLFPTCAPLRTDDALAPKEARDA